MDLAILMGLEKPHAQTVAGTVRNMDGSVPTRGPSKNVPIAHQEVIAARRNDVFEFVKSQGVTGAAVVRAYFKVSRDTADRDLLHLVNTGRIAVRKLQRMHLYYIPTDQLDARHA